MFEKQQGGWITNQAALAIKTSTESGDGRAIAQEIAAGILLEMEAQVPDVRFLYDELSKRLEQRHLAKPGTPAEKQEVHHRRGPRVHSS